MISSAFFPLILYPDQFGWCMQFDYLSWGRASMCGFTVWNLFVQHTGNKIPYSPLFQYKKKSVLVFLLDLYSN